MLESLKPMHLATSTTTAVAKPRKLISIHQGGGAIGTYIASESKGATRYWASNPPSGLALKVQVLSFYITRALAKHGYLLLQQKGQENMR
jgi:hypothetical protein